MYSVHFGLRDQPFSITPDPAYLFMSPHHQEALAHLLYGTGELGGFVQLTGEVGTGKTTLVRTLAEQSIEQLDVALCLNPRLTVVEFMAALCDELRVDYPREASTLKPLVDALSQHLLNTHARGRRTVLIIDEAQNLSRDVLEQVRLLTNLETHRHKLLRIILVGQPELQRLLARSDMRQLAQRITARYHLPPLRASETHAYIQHRLRIAGGREGLFTASALRAAYRVSRGIPRLINIICDRALLAAYVQGHERIDAKVLRQAAREALQGTQPSRSPHWLSGFATGLAATLLLTTGIWWTVQDSHPLRSQSALPDSVLPPPQPDSEPAEQRALADDSVPEADAQQLVAMLQEVPELLAEPDKPTPAQADTPAISPAVLPTTEAQLAPTSPPVDNRGEDPTVAYLLANLDPPALALGRLLSTWQDQPWDGDEQNCQRLASNGLQCLEGKGTMQELRQFNRPAILTLATPSGQSGQVLLRMLDGDAAIFSVEDNWLSLPLSQLEDLWNGEYLLLWRRQAGVNFIGPGVSGEPLNWLRQRLAMLDGGPNSGDPTTYDTSLRERVRAFQHLHGLEVDGLVGARTMTLLNNLQPVPGTPLLIREQS